MKKIYMSLLLILVLALTLSGCNKKEEVDKPIVKPPVVNPSEDVGKEEETKETFVEKFAEVLDKEDEPSKIISFIDDNVDKLSELDGDVMIDGLERKLQDNLDKTTDRIFELDKNNELIAISDKNNYEFKENNVADIKDVDLKAEVQKAYDNMYKFVNLEGQFYPIIDYSRLQKYNEHLTGEWKDYLAIMAMDSEKLPFDDGGIVISFDELAKRLFSTENYLNSYVEGQRQKEMLEMYENKIEAYLKGLPNTPIADRETNIIKQDVLASYEETANVENYMTSHILFKYLEFIKGNDNIIDDSILDEADRLIDEVMEVLTEFK